MAEREGSEDRWNALLRVTRSWRLEWNVDHLLQRICREAVELAQLDRGLVFMLEHTGIVNRGGWPELQSREHKQLLPIARNIAQQVVQSGRPLYAHELSEAKTEKGAGARMISCVPLIAGRGILGALYVDSRESQKGLTQKDQEFLEMLGLQAASALEHAILYQSAITDPLTGLYSHRHFQQEVEQSVRRALRAEEPVTLILIDLDHFKELNDTCGHAAGNQCLTEVSALLRDALRSSDIIARFGGDEFEVLLPGTESKNAVTVAEKIRGRIAKLKLPQDHKVTGTFGVAAFPQNALDSQSLFLRADEALYQAKEAGRNCVVCSRAKESSLPSPDSLRGQFSPRLASFPSPAVFNATLGAPASSQAAEIPNSPVLSESLPRAPGRLDAINEQVDGHRVIQRLGTGSTGEVLLVRQPDLNRDVALKRPLTPNLSAEQIEAFEQEARVTASLNHPGVVNIHTLGRDSDGRRYYTMNPLSGSSLAHILEGRKRGELEMLRAFNQRRLTEILQRVSETMAYAHQRGVAHLDLTPSNIIVGQFGDVTIIDWGSGSVSQGRPSKRGRKDKGPTQLAYLVGSPAYLAPELLPGAGAEPGPAADVYAIGAILYEMLTGRPPFLRETTIATLDALRSGELQPPEVVAPEAGIEPVLSRLCMLALQRDPKLRPTALELFEQLGRHVRQETSWEVIHFGGDAKGAVPMRAEDWTTLSGKWKLESGVWSSDAPHEHILLWNTPVTGGFRFVCEAWTDGISELALIGRGPPLKAGSDPRANYAGYCFEFGAELQTSTKLARNGHDMMVQGGLLPDKGRHYRMELEFDDGVLRCFIDNKIIFSYRDLFPESGATIGFYAFSHGAHLKPLEIHREVFGIRVPLIQVADELLRTESYSAALGRYGSFVEHFPQRLEGFEARLKMGICQARLGKGEEARAAFRALAGTPLEPNALAEEAILDFRAIPSDPANALKLCRDLLKRYPASHARIGILEIAHSNRRLNMLQTALSAAEAWGYIVEFERLAVQTGDPPAKSQIDALASCVRALHRLGRWREAQAAVNDFERRLHPAQLDLFPFPETKAMTSLALGENDFGGFLKNFNFGSVHLADWPSDLGLHGLVRAGMLQAYLDYKPYWPPVFETYQTRLLCRLAQRNVEEAAALAREAPNYLGSAAHSQLYQLGVALLDSHDNRLIALLPELLLLEHVEKRSDGHGLGEARHYWSLIHARLAIQRCDFESAARLAEEFDRPLTFLRKFPEGVLLQCMLSSLGYLKRLPISELVACRDKQLCGAPFDLSEMFLGRKDPFPNELWPHPLWRPELRLWLALWHEARRNNKAAYEIAAPCLDERYGLTHCQPALRALVARTEAKI